MKRLFLTVVALLSMTMTFAEENDKQTVENAEAYKLTINNKQLGKSLELTLDQIEAVKDVHHEFCSDMEFISMVEQGSKKMMMDNAIKKDLQYMKLVLDEKQYRRYLTLLNLTLHNRGLLK